MNYANPKNLSRGDLFTIISNDRVKKEILEEDRMRVLSVTIPFVYVERYDWREKEFKSSPWQVNVEKCKIIRLHKNAVTPIVPA